MRPSLVASRMISSTPASMIGEQPRLISSTLVTFLSTPMTSFPPAAMQADETAPTYPSPNTEIRIGVSTAGSVPAHAPGRLGAVRSPQSQGGSRQRQKQKEKQPLISRPAIEGFWASSVRRRRRLTAPRLTELRGLDLMLFHKVIERGAGDAQKLRGA